MFLKLEVYKIWAPDNVLWADWVKPIAFVNMESNLPDPLHIPTLNWITNSRPYQATAIIVDLPGKESVEEGLALARVGYRPVPLYNAVSNRGPQKMVVPMQEIEKALYDGAEELQRLNMNIGTYALPAFLLDSNRMKGFKTYGDFDNRWSIFAQDMPSASYLISKGIQNIIVRTDSTIQSDLEHILYRYQSAGITLFTYDGIERKQRTVNKPSKFKAWFYRFGVMMGLRRNSAGGFGGIIPEPGSGG